MPINLSLAELDERYELDAQVPWELIEGGLHIHIPPDDDIVILSEPSEIKEWLARRGVKVE
jgi:hypothetical protein